MEFLLFAIVIDELNILMMRYFDICYLLMIFVME